MKRYLAACFVSAFLLFGVEPLMGKFVLPAFGGGPAVWTACMLFFQLALLAGYAYAHLLATRVSARAQVKVHLVVLGLAGLAMVARAMTAGSPLSPGTQPAGEVHQASAFGVLASLGVSVGAPFFALASTAPLLQAWFREKYPERSPYRLYAVSNAGSVVSLLSYPVLLEPWLGRSAQSWGFGIGYVAFCVLCAACGREVPKGPERGRAVPDPATSTRPSFRQHALWIALAATASVLLLATTHRLSEEVAAGPFVWVIVLALYLCSFIVAFEHERFYSPRVFTFLIALGLCVIVRMMHVEHRVGLWPLVAGYGVTLFAGCMVLHGELYRLRPHPAYLTGFYLDVSVGGVLGGVFVGLIAPAVFKDFWEFPGVLIVLVGVGIVAVQRASWARRGLVRATGVLTMLALVLTVAAFTLDSVHDRRSVRWSGRNFFGVLSVVEESPELPDEHKYILKYGPITHGLQFTASERRHQPVSYYGPTSGLARAIAEARQVASAHHRTGLSLGVMGLGVGCATVFMQPEDSLRAYEINPLIIAIARGEYGFFDYLAAAPGKLVVIEGDARKSLEREPDVRFDVLAVDTFSGDAIPFHLLTTEAVALYQQHLTPQGILAIHVSNPHFQLETLVGAQATYLGLRAWLVENEGEKGLFSTAWVLLTAEGSEVEPRHFAMPGVHIQRLHVPSAGAWTDERNALVTALHEQ